MTNQMSPRDLQETKRQADLINQKHKAEGKNYGEAMGKDSFLELLVTELSHQDPTNPMEDRDFVAQMAQFSSLEQMNNLNTKMGQMNSSSKLSEAYNLLGKQIEGIDANTGEPLTGEVTRVLREQNEVMVQVNNATVRLDDVHAVLPPKEKPAPVQNIQTQAAQNENRAIQQKSRSFSQKNSYTMPTKPTIEGQDSTSKGVMNSFNNFYKEFDNSSTQMEKVKAAYSAQ